jgi:hypothetical protein
MSCCGNKEFVATHVAIYEGRPESKKRFMIKK